MIWNVEVGYINSYGEPRRMSILGLIARDFAEVIAEVKLRTSDTIFFLNVVKVK